MIDIIFQEVLFTEDECNSIISLGKNNFQTWENLDREYKSASIRLDENTTWIFERLKTFFENHTKHPIIKLKEEIHFHIFNIDDWFGIHNDARDNRLFSVGVLLNDNFTGGDFKLYTSGELILNKTIGNAYIFDVNVPHEITPIKLGTRYSLIWFIEHYNIKTKSNKLI